MPESKRPLKVFLSYASQDRTLVRELSRQLVDEGWIDTWVDEKSLLPGQDWRVKIEEAVEEADVVLICLSNHSVSKEGYVQKELRYAREIALEKPEETIFLIPLRLDECEVPRGLRFYQWVDYFGDEKNHNYDALVKSLKLRYEQKLKLEELERIREGRARLEAEELAKQKAEKEAVEKARLNAEELERQKVAREQAERKAIEKTYLDVEELEKRRIAKEQADRKKAEQRVRRLALLKENVARPLAYLKSNIAISSSKLRVAGFVGIAITVLGLGIWNIQKLNLSYPTKNPTATITSVLPVKTLSSIVTNTKATTSIPTALTTSKTPFPSRTPTKSFTFTPTSLPTEITDAKDVTMCLVPAGEFTMGSNSGAGDEKPVHQVYLDAFYMDKYEVTNALYKTCVDAGSCTLPQDTSSSTHSSYYSNSKFNDYPVIYVDWSQAKTYCDWRGGSLPTEAQWEKAARGTDGRTYPWGEGLDCNKANYYGKVGGCVGDTNRVGSYESGKSPYGIYDLAGNVWEWVSSLYKPYPYVSTDGREDLNVLGDRVRRGGSWGDFSDLVNVRSADRASDIPANFGPSLGFRCVRSLP